MTKRLSVKQTANWVVDGAMASAAGVIGGALIGPIGAPLGLIASSAILKDEGVRKTAYSLGAITLGGVVLAMILGGAGDKNQGVQ